MPATLCRVLAGMGHDVDTIPAEGRQGCNDDTVWSAAQSARRFLVTQDMDFSDLR